jgi:hypothetical protein
VCSRFTRTELVSYIATDEVAGIGTDGTGIVSTAIAVSNAALRKSGDLDPVVRVAWSILASRAALRGGEPVPFVVAFDSPAGTGGKINSSSGEKSKQAADDGTGTGISDLLRQYRHRISVLLAAKLATSDLQQCSVEFSLTEADAVLAKLGRQEKWLIITDDSDTLGDGCRQVAFPIRAPKGKPGVKPAAPLYCLYKRAEVRELAAAIPIEQRTELTRALAKFGPAIFELTAMLASDYNHVPGVGSSRAATAAAAYCEMFTPPANDVAFGLDVDLGELTTVVCGLPGVNADEAQVRASIELGYLRLNALAVASDIDDDAADADDDAVVVEVPLYRATAPAGSAAAAILDGTLAGRLQQLDPAAVGEQFGTRLPAPTRRYRRTGNSATEDSFVAPLPVLTKTIFIGLVRASIERQTAAGSDDRKQAEQVLQLIEADGPPPSRPGSLAPDKRQAAVERMAEVYRRTADGLEYEVKAGLRPGDPSLLADYRPDGAEPGPDMWESWCRAELLKALSECVKTTFMKAEVHVGTDGKPTVKQSPSHTMLDLATMVKAANPNLSFDTLTDAFYKCSVTNMVGVSVGREGEDKATIQDTYPIPKPPQAFLNGACKALLADGVVQALTDGAAMVLFSSAPVCAAVRQRIDKIANITDAVNAAAFTHTGGKSSEGTVDYIVGRWKAGPGVDGPGNPMLFVLKNATTAQKANKRWGASLDACLLEAEVTIPWRFMYNTDEVLDQFPIVAFSASLWGGAASAGELQAKADAGHYPSHKQHLGRIRPLYTAGLGHLLTDKQRKYCAAYDEAMALSRAPGGASHKALA